MLSILFLSDPLHVEISQQTHELSYLEKLAPFAWPLVVMVSVLLLLRPLKVLLQKIAERATELGFGSWATRVRTWRLRMSVSSNR